MTELLANLCIYVVVLGMPASFFLGLWWASRPKDLYHEDGLEEGPVFCRGKDDA